MKKCVCVRVCVCVCIQDLIIPTRIQQPNEVKRNNNTTVIKFCSTSNAEFGGGDPGPLATLRSPGRARGSIAVG